VISCVTLYIGTSIKMGIDNKKSTRGEH